MFLRVLEFLLIALSIWFVITQVAIPVWRKQRLFPIFQRRWELEGRLEEVQEKVSEQKLEKEIARTAGKLEEVPDSEKESKVSDKRASKR